MSVEFVDTNLLVYAYDPSSGHKHRIARELVVQLWENGDGALSVQVLQEFFWTVTRKVPNPLPVPVAIEIVQELTTWRVYAPTGEDVVRAAELSARFKIAFWDAMILRAAIGSGASVLLTEDLTDGANLGGVRIRNPFAAV